VHTFVGEKIRQRERGDNIPKALFQEKIAELDQAIGSLKALRSENSDLQGRLRKEADNCKTLSAEKDSLAGENARLLTEMASITKNKAAKTSRLFRVMPLPLSADEVDSLVRKHDFFDANRNKEGKGIVHRYEKQLLNDKEVVFDHNTSLMWQQSGSGKYDDFGIAQQFIADLNSQKYAGFSDWRLPTLEEAMSLMEPVKRNGDLYIDPIFDARQKWIWTCDPVKGELSRGWVVGYFRGICDHEHFLSNYVYFVRAVRSGQSSTH
jgi:hypothetical protein